MKKSIGFGLIALAMGCTVALSGCAGCGGSSKNTAYLSSNWYANTGFKKIQPTFIGENDDFNHAEKITYSVTFDNSNAGNKTYSVEYGEGKYTTLFYAKTFDKSKVDPSFASSYPEGDVTAYYYKTELSVPSVTYKCGGETRIFADGESVVSESYFLSVEKRLQPLYSKQIIHSYTPAELQPSNVDKAYREVRYSYESFYSYDGRTVKTYIDGDEKSERVCELNSDNTVFDSAYLDIVVRANKLGANLSQAVSLYTPAGALKNFSLSGGVYSLSDEEKTVYEAELKKNKLYKEETYTDENGETKVKRLETNEASVNYNASLTGVSQIYWFAAVNNANNNTGRATLIKIAQPSSFSLGTRYFKLLNIGSTLYND